MSHRWLVAQTQPRRETYASCMVDRLDGFEPYGPWFHDKQKGRLSRLFPSYLFVKVEGSASLLFSTPGIVRVLMTDGKPAVIADEVIEAIKSRENEDGNVVLPTQLEPFKRGDELRIVGDNPWSGLFGIYEGMTAHNRVVMLMSLFGRSSRVRIPITQVAAAA